MTIYAIQLRQAQGGGGYPNTFKYSNVFYANKANAGEAADLGYSIWQAMAAAMFESAYCYSIYATDLAPATVDYFQLPVASGDQRGLLAPVGGAQTAHPIICARVDLIVPASRPSRKFVRGGYASDVFANGQRAFVGTYLTTLSDAFASILTAAAGALCDVDGTAVTSSVVMGVTTRELGREAFSDVPTPPPFG